jgi:hypothetical protein
VARLGVMCKGGTRQPSQLKFMAREGNSTCPTCPAPRMRRFGAPLYYTLRILTPRMAPAAVDARRAQSHKMGVLYIDLNQKLRVPCVSHTP